jgi:hypothetical protein
MRKGLPGSMTVETKRNICQRAAGLEKISPAIAAN